jgi:hypothetical protein
MKILPLFFMFAILLAALQAAAFQPSCLLQVSTATSRTSIYLRNSPHPTTLPLPFQTIQSSTLNRFSLATGYGWHLSNGNW